MNIDKVNRVVNSNLKLYKKSYIGHITKVSVVALGTLIFTNFSIDMINTITSISIKFAALLGIEIFDTALITCTMFKTRPKYNKNKIKKLKKLKEELNSGINRFENIPPNELSNEIIKYLRKRKVK